MSTRKGFRRNEKDILEQGPPIDLSFKGASSLDDLQNEKPRQFRVGRLPTHRAPSLKYLSRSIWVNNNSLINVQGLEKLVNKFLEQPSALAWIDLSYNNVTDIHNEFLQFPNLRILYLHSNCIQSLVSVENLRGLKLLKTITFQGNPIESIPSYRSHIINLLPQINNLDFTPVVPAEREAVPPAGFGKKLQQLRSSLR